MAVFLLLALAYWWLDNLRHELFGTALFILLGWHIVENRVWFKNLLRGRYDAIRVAVLVLHLFLIANMLVLLATSIVISKSIFSFLPVPDSIYLREVHWFSAYWVMIIVGSHAGLHWSRVLGIIRTKLGLRTDRPAAVILLRILSVALCAFGAWSWSVLGVWTKLTFNYSLDFWDFTASVTPFFGHWAAVMALPAVVAHYAISWWKNRRRSAGRHRRLA
jgi:hypothetical protein